MVDREPAVGRFVIGKAPSTAFFQWFERAGRITKIAGHRIYYEAFGKSGYMHDFEVVCDTEDEVAKIMDFTAYVQQQHFQILRKLGEEKEKLLSSMGLSPEKFREPANITVTMATLQEELKQPAVKVRRTRR